MFGHSPFSNPSPLSALLNWSQRLWTASLRCQVFFQNLSDTCLSRSWSKTVVCKQKQFFVRFQPIMSTLLWGRGGECLHERIFLCRDFPALIASRSRHLARGNACQQVTSFVLTLIGWNCILALWLAHFVFVNTVGQCDKKTYLFSLISVSVGL